MRFFSDVAGIGGVFGAGRGKHLFLSLLHGFNFFVEFIHSVEDKFFAFETGPILPLQWLCSKRQWLIFLPKD